MDSDKYRFLVLALLTIAFLGYSFELYIHPAKDKGTLVVNSKQADQGKMVWQEKNCTSCHQIYGLGGHLGPDLTNVVSKRPKAYIEAFLKSGTDVMPNFNLSQEEIDALMAYLTAIDQSGQADPRTFKLHLDGTVSQ